MVKEKDITGNKYNYLTAIKKVGCDKWLFKCDCGREVIASKKRVIKGTKKCCGCLTQKMKSDSLKKHGLSKTRIFKIWVKMKERCEYKKSNRYVKYGGRGISVCQEWRKNVKNFYDWAIKNGYKDDLTIDRIDVDGDYCPENCRWATYKEQARNKHTNSMFEINGEIKCLAEWCEIFGLPYKKTWENIKKNKTTLNYLINNKK